MTLVKPQVPDVLGEWLGLDSTTAFLETLHSLTQKPEIELYKTPVRHKLPDVERLSPTGSRRPEEEFNRGLYDASARRFGRDRNTPTRYVLKEINPYTTALQEIQKIHSKAPDIPRNIEGVTESNLGDIIENSFGISPVFAKVIFESMLSKLGRDTDVYEEVIPRDEFLSLVKQHASSLNPRATVFSLMQRPDATAFDKDSLCSLINEMLYYVEDLSIVVHDELTKEYVQSVGVRIRVALDLEDLNIPKFLFLNSPIFLDLLTMNSNDNLGLEVQATTKKQQIFSTTHMYFGTIQFAQLTTEQTMTKDILLCYARSSLSPKVIDRIMAIFKSRTSADALDFESFFEFLILENNRLTRYSMKFWFDVLDLDGDMVIRPPEVEMFWTQTAKAAAQANFECSRPEFHISQLLDILKPRDTDYITLSDFFKCPSATQQFLAVLLSVDGYITAETAPGYQGPMAAGNINKDKWEESVAMFTLTTD